MNIHLADGNQITANAFQGCVWITVQACGGRLGVKLTPVQAEELGLAIYFGARKMKREQAKGARR